MFPASAEQLCLRLRPTFRQQVCPRRTGSFLQVAKYLLNDDRIFDTSDDLNGTAAFTCLDINAEDTLGAVPRSWTPAVRATSNLAMHQTICAYSRLGVCLAGSAVGLCQCVNVRHASLRGSYRQVYSFRGSAVA